MKNNKLAIITIIIIFILLILSYIGSLYKEQTKIKEENKYKKQVIEENTKLSPGSYTYNNNGKNVTINALYIIDGIKATIGSGTYESIKDNEVVFLVVNGGKLIIQNSTINKSSKNTKESEINDGSNSAIVVLGNNSSAIINNIKINTNGTNNVGLITGNGSSAIINDSDINTNKEYSPGVYTFASAKINGENNNIITNGKNSPAITGNSSGEEVKFVGKNTLNTNGSNSPIVFGNINIKLKGVSGNAKVSNCISTLPEKKVVFVSSNLKCAGESAIYSFQEEEVDISKEAKYSITSIKDSTIDYIGKGPFVYITNSYATFNFTNNKLDYSSNRFITAMGEKLGLKGKNGGRAIIECKKQIINGDFYADELSGIVMRIKNKSIYKGKTHGSVSIIEDIESKKTIEGEF